VKNLLIITSRYPHPFDKTSGNYVYSQVNELKNFFNKIVVISTTPYIPKFLSKWMSDIRKRDSLAKNYSYDNVSVYFTKNIIFPIKFLKKIRGNQEFRRIKKIIHKIKFKPDYIHAHFTWTPGYIAVRLKKEFKVPIIITIHEDHNWLLEEEKSKDNCDTWKNADVLIRVNKLDVALLKKYNNRIFNIPNGYDERKFKLVDKVRCRNSLKLPEKIPIIFSLGYLEQRKGFHDLIESVKLVKNENKDFLIVIGGSGPEKVKLETQIAQNKLNSYIHLIGFVPANDVPLWINAADFFVLPSYSEGNPVVMFEVLGCGKPFLGTNVGGIPEIIINNKLGILIPPGNPPLLANAILTALNQKWDQEYILGYASQFTWKNIADNILEIYKILV